MKSAVKGDDQSQHLGPLTHMALASASGACVLAVTNPIWVVKTRMCLHVEPTGAGVKAAAGGAVPYRGVLDGLVRLLREEGLAGAYKGFAPGLIGTSHGAVQFMVYEELKHLLFTRKKAADDNGQAAGGSGSSTGGKGDAYLEPKLSPLEYICMAALSKACATAATYPYQVMRSRLQEVPPRYTGSVDVLSKVILRGCAHVCWLVWSYCPSSPISYFRRSPNCPRPAYLALCPACHAARCGRTKVPWAFTGD